VSDARVGAYTLLAKIGEGGMGEVWLAEHTVLERRAAIKLLNARASADPDLVARFLNEARAATAIADPGIVQVFDVGQTDNGTAYIVMELLEGETLHARLQRGTLALTDVLRIVRQVASSLGAAHERGIVHRDLKPENIFLVRDPEVVGGERAKILDFGIAKLTGIATGVQTHASMVMGTPMYMSPEQCRGAGEVDERADIYSLGCVLFTLLAGRPPFNAEGAGELIALHLMEPAPRVSAFVPGVPVLVDELVARCLDKIPAARYANGAALAEALGSLVVDGRITPGPYLVPVSMTTLTSAISVSQRAPRRSRTRIAIVAASIVMIAGAGIVIVTRDHGTPTPTPPTPGSAVVEVREAPPPPIVLPPLPPPVDQTGDLTTTVTDALDAAQAWAKTHRANPGRPARPIRAVTVVKPPPVPPETPPEPKPESPFVDNNGDGIPDKR